MPLWDKKGTLQVGCRPHPSTLDLTPDFCLAQSPGITPGITPVTVAAMFQCSLRSKTLTLSLQGPLCVRFHPFRGDYLSKVFLPS